MRTVIITLLCLLLVCFPVTESDERSHRYEKNEYVLLWMNTVGPYHNKQETYSYYSLPFCSGNQMLISYYHETLAETLLGNELQYSGLDFNFKMNTSETQYCETEIDEDKYNAFAYAIKNQYWYQMYIDDLPIWGIVGFYESDNSYYLWTHRTFHIGYNGDQIVDVNVSCEASVKLEKGAKIAFSYSVYWIPSTVKFEDRFDSYLDPNFMQHRLHWFSIVNSFILALFLIGLVSRILRKTLHKNNFNYRKDQPDDMVRGIEDDSGWKQIHGDVFRPPVHPMMFTVLVGTGYQLIATVLCVVAFTIIGKLYTVRGSVLSTILFVYAATSSINGYFGGSLYVRMGGKLWMRQVAYSAFLLPFFVGMTTVVMNFVAIYFHTSGTIPFGMMVDVIGLCLFVIFPLTLVGTILGKSVAGQPNHPCPVDAVPRPIPKRKWFQQPVLSAYLGGMLPFGSIFVALYFILTSFWHFKVYYVYGFLLLSFIVLAIITACITVVITYFLLNAQDYRWQWTSFLSGASTGLYVYMYSIYFFFYKTEMYGFFQTAFYFVYMGVFSSVVGIMCGTFGYMGASLFVKKIYSLHCETEMLKEIFTLQLNQEAPSENRSISSYIKTAVHEMKNKWRNLQSSYVARKFLDPQKKTFSNMDEICAKALLDGESSDKSDTSHTCDSCGETGLQICLDAPEDQEIEKGVFINDETQNLHVGKTEVCGSSTKTPATTVCESSKRNMHDDVSPSMQEKA